MATQRSKGTVKINSVGTKRMAPGNTEIVHAGEFRHGAGVRPDLKRVAKYDHGQGPKEYTHMGKGVAKSGKSQSPKQVYLSPKGLASNTKD
jgi:hypothetical protein